MEKIFIPAYSKEKFALKLKDFLKLPRQIALVYSIQYYKQALNLKAFLEKNKFKISKFSQTLGCLNQSFLKDTKAVLLIGSGRFHAVSLAIESSLPIYIYEAGKIEKISEKEIKELKSKKKVAYMHFLSSNNIGILVSNKPGQQKLEEALEIKCSLESKFKNKKFFIFLSNNINTSEFENFGIASWINTACPRLDFDYNFLNKNDLKAFKLLQ